MPANNPAIKKAEQILIDNGIETDEAGIVLQAIGYALLDMELYPEEKKPYNERTNDEEEIKVVEGEYQQKSNHYF